MDFAHILSMLIRLNQNPNRNVYLICLSVPLAITIYYIRSLYIFIQYFFIIVSLYYTYVYAKKYLGSWHAIPIINEITSDQYVNYVKIINDHYIENQDPIKSFVDRYKQEGCNNSVNVARRHINSVYYKIMLLNEQGILSDEWVREIVKQRHIRFFINKIQPLTESRSKNNDYQRHRKFWERFSTEIVAKKPV